MEALERPSLASEVLIHTQGINDQPLGEIVEQQCLLVLRDDVLGVGIIIDKALVEVGDFLNEWKFHVQAGVPHCPDGFPKLNDDSRLCDINDKERGGAQDEQGEYNR